MGGRASSLMSNWKSSGIQHFDDGEDGDPSTNRTCRWLQVGRLYGEIAGTLGHRPGYGGPCDFAEG